MNTLTKVKDFEDTIVTYLKSGETNRPLIVFGQNSNTKEESAKKAFNQQGKGYYRWDYMCARKPEQEQWERAIEKQASVLIDMPYMEQPIIEDGVLNDFLQDRGLSVVLLLRSTKEDALKVMEKYGDAMQYAFYEVAASKRIHIVYEPEFDSFMPAPILDLTFDSDTKQLTCQFKDDGRDIEEWKTMQLHSEDKEDLIDFLSDKRNVQHLFEAKIPSSSSQDNPHYEEYRLLIEDEEKRNLICTGAVCKEQMPFDIIANNYRYGHRTHSLKEFLKGHPFEELKKEDYRYGFGAFCLGAKSSMPQSLTEDMVELLWQQYASLINFRNANLLVNEVCHYNKTYKELQQQTWLMKIWRDNLEEAVIDCPMTENVLNESPFDFCIPALPIEMLPLKGFLSYLLSAYVFSDFQEDFTQENPTWTTRIYGEEDMVRDMTNVEHIYIPELAELFALYTQHCLSEQKNASDKVTLPTEDLRAEQLQSLYLHERNLWADVKPSLPLYISESFAVSIVQHMEDYLTYLLHTIRQYPKYADYEKEKATRNRASNVPDDHRALTKEGLHYKAKIRDIFQHAKSDYEIGGLLYKFQHEYKWITKNLARNSYYRYIQNLIGSERAIDASNANKGYY